MLNSDYDKVRRLWEKTEGVGLSSTDSRENIEKFLERNPGLSYVSIIDDKVAGAILCGHDGRRGYIHHLAVDEAYRGMNIGTKLTSECLEALRKIKIDKCHLFVFEGNDVGNAFWCGTGWQKREDLLVYSRLTNKE